MGLDHGTTLCYHSCMDISEAIVAWKKRHGKKDEDIAVIVGVTAYTVGTWRKNQAKPRYEHVCTMRDKMPDFAGLLDGKVAA